MKALFIGRFQPFHKGHLHVLKFISNQYDEIIIGIGSSQYKNKIDNPFSEDERKKMIVNSFEKNQIKNYKIVPIPDIHDPPNWVAHVLNFVNDFDIVISHNSLTLKLFSEKGFKTVIVPTFKKEKYSGRNIRDRMRKGLDWEDLVPESVVSVIKEINGVKRLKEISK